MNVQRNNRITIVTILVAIIVGCISALAGVSYAEVQKTDKTTAAIAIYNGDTLAKTFTREEISEIDSVTCTYSAFNSIPNLKNPQNVEGVPVASILNSSGISVESISDNQVIEFVGNDGASIKILKKQLFADRYFFPNAKSEMGRNGKTPLASSWTGRQSVPPMISLKDETQDQAGRLLMGQISPTEQNYSVFLKYILCKNTEIDDAVLNGSYENRKTALDNGEFKIGQIIVHTASTGKWNPIRTTTPKSGSFVKLGKSIAFTRSVNPTPDNFSKYHCIYFTTDGTEPGMSSNIYNFNNRGIQDGYEKINQPKITKEGRTIIKTKVIGYGAEDSAVTTFTFIGYKTPGTGKIKIITAKKKALKLKWTKASNAHGYKIYRATKKKGKYKLVKTIRSGKTVSWTNKKLKKKKTYYYKIRPYRVVSGKTFYGKYSSVKYKRTK